MEPLDRWLLKKVDEVQTQRDVQKLLDNYAGLEEKAQETVKTLLGASIFALPALLVILIALSNQSVKNANDVKQDLLTTAQSLISSTAQSQSMTKMALGMSPVNNQSAFQTLISASLRSVGIDASKVTTANYEVIEHDGLINQSIMELKFKDFSNNEIFEFLNTLSQRQKIRFDQVSVKKNLSSNLLEGVMTLHYYSQEPL